MGSKRYIIESSKKLVEMAVDNFIKYSNEVIRAGKQFNIALAGGNTPKAFYRALARPELQEQLRWDKVHLFWGDERCLPPDDIESNFRLVNHLLISRIHLPGQNIHRILGENEPNNEIKRYSAEIQDHFGIKTDVPIFDWVLLGIGKDGHVASIFPNSGLYYDGEICALTQHPKSFQKRITLTLKVFLNAKKIFIFAIGEDKASIVSEIINNNPEASNYPACQINSFASSVEWYLDRCAASLLEKPFFKSSLENNQEVNFSNLKLNENNNKLPFLIECFDVGGTQIRAALIEDGKIIHSIPAHKSIKNNPKLIIQKIKEISQSLRKTHWELFDKQIQAVSIGVPGPVKNGVMLGSRPLRIDENINFQTYLGDHFKEPVLVENDMNMAIHGEWAIGEGITSDNFCLITLSTGIGIGLVFQGKIYNRNTEIGHMIIEKDPQLANPCFGHSGCWVAQASGDGISKTLEKLGLNFEIANFFENANYEKLVQCIKAYNAHAFGNLINAYDPEKIIIMGSLGINQFDQIIPDKKAIAEYTLIQEIPEVKRTKLGDEIGLYGAFYKASHSLCKS